MKEIVIELSHKNDHDHHGEHLSHHAHSIIGVALVVGFIFMLVVDQVTRSATGRGDSGRGRYKITATVGLVVHAAADGIALGAASSAKHSDIQFIVFVAIMLHKAPAAFGLVTFLMVEGLEKMRIRRHLLFFSLAAPVMAVITYMGIAQGGSETLSSMSSTGVLMLFSAGTFLYVSTVHVLPELVNSAPKSPGYHLVESGGLPTSSSPSAAGHSHHASNGFKLNEVFALIVGAGVPALLSIGHSH
uniref:Solute carrier family 39 member 9 n=1 Tax=Plectus sambesii TaxID=2011161 RepID=A0A914UNB7_9BILA